MYIKINERNLLEKFSDWFREVFSCHESFDSVAAWKWSCGILILIEY